MPKKIKPEKADKDSSLPAPLTLSELEGVTAYLKQSSDEKAKQDEMRMSYGSAANLPEVEFLDLCNEALMHYESDRWQSNPPMALRHAIFKTIFEVVLGNEAEFAKRLSILLLARRNKEEISKIPARKLGIKQGRGRKVRPSDWIHVVPAAVDRVLGYRVFEHPADGLGLRRVRITRTEIREAIRLVQEESGFDTSVKISEGELSTWITKLNIRQFMHDPHREPIGPFPKYTPLIVTETGETYSAKLAKNS